MHNVNPFAVVLVTILILFASSRFASAQPATQPSTQALKRLPVAALVTIYHHNSHADVIASRLLLTDTLDGKGRESSLELVSLFRDQKEPWAGTPRHRPDLADGLSAKFQFPIYPDIRSALTRGGDKLAVDGVLLVAEHGEYPRSATGNIQYPKRRFFDEMIKVFKDSNRVVPVFIDKHLGDNWADIKHVYDTAKGMHIPMMAGSSLPGLWRYPPVDVKRGAELKQIVALSYHTLDAYGFHALEFVQALAERRKGGETGIAAVQTLSGDAVWQKLDSGDVDKALYDDCFARLRRPLNGTRPVREAVKDPSLFILEYKDGLKAFIFTLNGAVGEWTAAWRYGEAPMRAESALFYTQEARPFMHFAFLNEGIEKMMHTGKPTWPVERTLLSSGALDSLLISQMEGGKRIETPQLLVGYQSDWDWRQPPPPPPDRPIDDQ
jgi:hypothetical protein